jgi:hypothetical protein
MTSPYQFAMVGCTQVIPLSDLAPNAQLKITSMFDWANYRWLIKPLFGVIAPSITFIHEVQSASASASASGVYDTGWRQSRAAGYAPGAVIASADTLFFPWWTGEGLTVPETRLGLPDFSGPIPLGYGCTGISVTSFVYFGAAFDADTQQLGLKVSDASGLNLVPIGGGYYQDTVSGKIYRPSWLPPYTDPTSTPNELSLETIVSRICRRGGLSDQDFDASALSSVMVGGYPIARQSTAADCLLPLMQAFFGYGSEYDAKLNFNFYGENSSITVDVDDLIEGNDANNGNIVSNLRNQATEFPRRIVASYMDPVQNYSVVNVFAERQALDVIAIGDQTFAIPVVMSAGDATKAANKALKVAYATLEGTLEYSVPYADSDIYIKLAAGEPLQFQGKRYVMDEMILSNGYIKMTARYDRQSAYTSNVQPVEGNTPAPPVSKFSGPTTVIPLNIPSQRPQDSLGVYLCAASSDGRAGWAGCNLQVSYDGMQTWQTAMTITEESTIGLVAADDLGNAEPLTVQTIKFDLESATPEQLAAKSNAFAIVNASQQAQLAQFSTADELTAERMFDLTGLSWSLGGTTEFGPELNDRFTLMDAAYFLPIDVSFAGSTIFFRGVGFGETADGAAVVSIVYSPDLTVIHDGGVIT